MTDLATALADTSQLPPYGGKAVVRTAIKITNAGDGLSQGLAIDPQVLALGETHYVVLECVVDSHEHDRILDRGNDTGLVVLNQVLKAGTGTLIDKELVASVIAEQATRIEAAKDAALRAKEEAEGIQRIPYGDELQDAHDKGEHADGLVPNCPSCDAELAAQNGEAEAPSEPPAEPTPIAGRKRR